MVAKPKVQEIVIESKPGSLILAIILTLFAGIILFDAMSYSINYSNGFIAGIFFTILFFAAITCVMKYHKSRKIYIKEVTNGTI